MGMQEKVHLKEKYLLCTVVQRDKTVSNEALIHFTGWANKAAETFNDLLKVRQKVRRRTHFIPNYAKSVPTLEPPSSSFGTLPLLLLF